MFRAPYLVLWLLLFCGPARAGWVLSLYTGVSHTFASDLSVSQSATRSQATFEGVSWAPHPYSQGAPYYGLRISYFAGRADHLGAALDYTHYKMYLQTADSVHVQGIWNGTPVNAFAPLAQRVQRLEIAHGVNLASLNAVYRFNPDFAKGRWDAHAGAGLLVYVPHSDGVIDGVGVNERYQYGGAGGQLFAGTEYKLLQHVALMLEGKFDAGSVDIDLDPSTRIHTQVRSVHLFGGVALHF